MTGVSHLVIGGSLALIGLTLIGDPTRPELLIGPLLLGLLASVLLDVDAENSVLQQSLHQSGRATIADTLISQKQRKHLFEGLLHAFLSIVELGVRLSLQGLIEILKLFVRHRGPTHYLVAAMVLTFLLSLGLYWLELPLLYAFAFGLGYLSHLLADMMTLSGVALLSPFSRRAYFLLPKRYRVRTRSGAEAVIVLVVLSLSALVVWLRLRWSII